MKTFALLFLLLVPMVFAQTDRPRFDRTEWALLSADAAVRGLDMYSTHRALSGGIVLGQYYAARKLFPRHRTLAYLITAADVSITAPFAVRNLYMPLCASGYIDTIHGCQAP